MVLMGQGRYTFMWSQGSVHLEMPSFSPIRRARPFAILDVGTLRPCLEPKSTISRWKLTDNYNAVDTTTQIIDLVGEDRDKISLEPISSIKIKSYGFRIKISQIWGLQLLRIEGSYLLLNNMRKTLQFSLDLKKKSDPLVFSQISPFFKLPNSQFNVRLVRTPQQFV